MTATPSRHSSGRVSGSSNKTLWAGWAIVGDGARAWYSGDSGYQPGLPEIGSRLGPFDIALVEAGQYDSHWPDNHYGPELAVAAAREVGAATLVPVHWALFSLAPHAWTEPVERVLTEAGCRGVPVRVLRPGEPTELGAGAGTTGTVSVGRSRVASARWWPDVATRRYADAPVQPTVDGDPGERIAFTPCE